MTKLKFVLKAVFVTLDDGLLIFHSSHETVWQDIYQPDLDQLTATEFENFTVQQLFLTGLVENLRDLDPNKGKYKIKYIFALRPKDQILPSFDLRLKYIEYDKIKTLSPKSKLQLFCHNFLP